jgi:CRP/FNR family transcriptional regulator, cyclic AMP receptor protein
MPIMDGYAVLEAIRNHDQLKSTPFIFLTAYSEKAEIEKGMRLGATDYIVKPFEPEVLYEIIHKFLS